MMVFYGGEDLLPIAVKIFFSFTTAVTIFFFFFDYGGDDLFLLLLLDENKEIPTPLRLSTHHPYWLSTSFVMPRKSKFSTEKYLIISDPA